MKGFVLCAMTALWSGVGVATPAGPCMANGIKIGEVTPDSAIVWVRLTENPERNVTGLPFAPEAEAVPPGHVLADMEGSVPGTAGEVCVRYRVAGTDHWTALPWRAVDQARDYTHQFALRGLTPGTRYELNAQGRPPSGTRLTVGIYSSFKTAPAPSSPAPVSFMVVTGQDYHRRDDPEHGHRVYPIMQQLHPSFFVHTGDIEYYDKPGPFAKTRELARFKWHRIYAMPFQRGFHNAVPAYFIKDDHDTLKNDCWPGQHYGDLTWEQGLATFREQVPMGESTYRTVRWGRDLQIWLVEGRDFRSPNSMPDGPDKTIWGAAQKAWFFDTVSASDATFRVLISPTPIVGPDRESKNDNHANAGFSHEGDEIRAFIGGQENMFVVCGDRHWQYYSVAPETGVREFSCGPTTDAHAGGFSEKQRTEQHRYLRVAGGFLQVSVGREQGEPGITFRHYDVHGEVQHEETFREE